MSRGRKGGRSKGSKGGSSKGGGSKGGGSKGGGSIGGSSKTGGAGRSGERRPHPAARSERSGDDRQRPQLPGQRRVPGGTGRFRGGAVFERRERDEEPTGDGAGWSAARAETLERLATWRADADRLRAAGAAATTNGDTEEATRLDPWQREVFEALMAGRSVVVDAPTTAGKTRAVEAYFRANLHRAGFRAAYTTPVKSLSNDKLREFRVLFGAENVGIATGDIKENLGAPIVVATLESYRNSLLGTEPDLGRTLVVFDEYHYMQDESRGSAWEEALILTPGSCQLLLLSASVANAEQFVDWLKTLGGKRRSLLGKGGADPAEFDAEDGLGDDEPAPVNPPPDLRASHGRDVIMVRTERRPVPLVPLVYAGRQWLLPEAMERAGLARGLDRTRLETPLRQEDLAPRAAALVELGLTPTIIYCGRRLACETMAGQLVRELAPLDEASATRIGTILETSHREFGALSFINHRLRHMLQVYGVGYHHSGLAAPARMAVEQLVKGGHLRFCTATMGLSLGINFSVRSALISDYKRPSELGFTEYGPSEVLQMLGRAGRRGRDPVGFSLWPTPEAMARLGKPRRDQIRSRLRNDPTTFLGLIGRGFSLRAIESFYGKSFLRFQDPASDLSLITKTRLMRKLASRDLPCNSPAAEATRFLREEADSACHQCPKRKPCHRLLETKSRGSTLAALHLHLHGIGALDRDESLTEFGTIARYFPQAGGLLLARMIADGRITADNVHRAAELAAALALARFKEPGAEARYRLPFDAREVERSLEELYPEQLFPEVYDPPYGRRTESVLREFNPSAGFIIRAWLEGMPWDELTDQVTHEQYGTGDVMSLIYRTATYLQSMVQARLAFGLADTARILRDALLREPLSFILDL